MNKKKIYLAALSALFLFPFFSNQLSAQVQNELWINTDLAPVQEACWSPDGNKIASSGWDGCVSIWDGSNGQLLNKLYGHSFSFLPVVTSVNWSHKGDRIVSGGDQDLIIWDAYNYSLIKKINAGYRWVFSARWSPNDSLIAYESYGTIHIINSKDASEKALFELSFGNPGGIKTAVCWENNNIVLACSTNGEFCAYDISKDSVICRKRFYDNYYGIYDIDFSSQKDLLSLVTYRTIYLIDALTYEVKDTINASQDYLWSVPWSPDGRFLVTSGNWSRVRVYDPDSKNVIGIIPYPEDTVQTTNRSLAWSPDGTKLLVGSELKGQIGSISVWNINITYTGLSPQIKQKQPENYLLLQNYPNPFNPLTVIKYYLPSNSRVSIRVFNILGQMVKEIVNKEMTMGFHSITFDGSNLASGTYLYKINAVSLDGNKEFIATKKMIILK